VDIHGGSLERAGEGESWVVENGDFRKMAIFASFARDYPNLHI